MLFKIIPATLRDLNALRTLEDICFPEDAWSLFDLVAVLTFPGVIRLKSVKNGKMVGFIAGDPRPSQGFSWIATFGVLPDYRRQGIGRELLHRCEEQLSTPRVRLSVRLSNKNAIQLYRQEGYQTIDIWEKYYKDGSDAVLMEKSRIE
ncbi:MAG: GNAT family N-acetyltransferase [Anaerolineales bacterium]|uniref:GNAT family N-acetyltransferase n=1 Tax=Candidatus Desulfolinea nitratireducens TaxID=2841698 RepID=A0A8J6TDI8_9CHLR|nr:GNAT family N-acetyltransferase [Candidatus Desulfolinea nitratireducens]MBL6961897.1 GNAT family N-acetyltransferase [Anaerolineales bacterium]